MVTQLSPGLILSGQKRFDYKMTMYSHLLIDVPVIATVPSQVSTNQVSYGATGGLLFGQFWPLAFGGEIQYRVDHSSTAGGSDTVNVTTEGISLVLNTTYAL